jgi:hypothetical protein
MTPNSSATRSPSKSDEPIEQILKALGRRAMVSEVEW